MAIHYSPARRGFFDSDLHDCLPDDAIYIRPSRHAELMDQQAQGGRIEPSEETGRPVAVWPCADERRAALLRSVKAEARRRIDAISPLWRQINDSRQPSAAGFARFALIDAVRAASTAIEQQLAGTAATALEHFGVRTNPLWPETA